MQRYPHKIPRVLRSSAFAEDEFVSSRQTARETCDRSGAYRCPDSGATAFSRLLKRAQYLTGNGHRCDEQQELGCHLAHTV
jgi:hypothetical protein